MPSIKADRWIKQMALERDLLTITHSVGLTHPGELRREHLVINVGWEGSRPLTAVYPYPGPAAHSPRPVEDSRFDRRYAPARIERSYAEAAT